MNKRALLKKVKNWHYGGFDAQWGLVVVLSSILAWVYFLYH